MTPLPDPLPQGERELFLKEATPPLRGTPPREGNYDVFFSVKVCIIWVLF